MRGHVIIKKKKKKKLRTGSTLPLRKLPANCVSSVTSLTNWAFPLLPPFAYLVITLTPITSRTVGPCLFLFDLGTLNSLTGCAFVLNVRFVRSYFVFVLSNLSAFGCLCVLYKCFNHPFPSRYADLRTLNRTRHIALRERYVFEKAAEGMVTIIKVPSSEQVSDMFTKPLAQKLLLRHCDALGLSFPNPAQSITPATCLLCNTDLPSKNKLHAHICASHPD